MKKNVFLFFAALLAFCGVGNVQAQDGGETDVTTLTWVKKGQDCTQDFNNDNGSTVYGTDASGSNLSYVDVSDYGTIKLYGPASQRARLFINREECGDNGIFYVDLDAEGVGTFDCNTILEKQPKAQYIHLNGVKASAYNTTLNLSRITVSGTAITFPEVFIIPEGETDLTTLEWVNEGQGCANNLGLETNNTIYGTDASPSDGKLSYFDITNYGSAKLWGPVGTVVRLFINRAEFPDNFQFYVTVGEDGFGTLDLADVYAKQEGAEYVHLNGVKASWGATAKIDGITLTEKPFVFPEGEIDITALEWVNEAQGCDNRIGEDTDATVYGTHDSANGDGNLSYADLTPYKTLNLYGRVGDVVRLFINRAEYKDATFQFYVTIGEDGIGTFNLSEVYTTQEGAKYVHLNGIKTATTWGNPASPIGKAKIKGITVKDAVRTISATTNLASFSCPANVTVPAGVAVYKAAVAGNVVTLTKVLDGEGVIPANTGVILYSDTEGEKTFTITTAAGSDGFDGNDLIATSVAANATIPADGTCYALMTSEQAFAKVAADTRLSSNKAYLKVAESAGARLRVVFMDDECTGIVSAETQEAGAQELLYNIAGQKVTASFKGVVIKNGKKAIVK